MIPKLWVREQTFVQDVIVPMESRGIHIDKEACRRQIAIGQSEMNRIREELNGRNPLSGKDLKVLLIDELGLPIVKRSPKTGAPSFDKTAMAEYDEMLSHRDSPLAKRILIYRGWSKAISANYQSYLDKVSPVDGRLRPNFWVHGTQTSRLSASEPATQQIPRSGSNPWNGKMKEVFDCEDNENWCLPNIDYGQLELRLAAAYSKQENMIEILNDPSRHIFREMAAATGRPYTQVKTFMYAALFGAQPGKIGSILGLDPDDAADFADSVLGLYPNLFEFSTWVNNQARRRGYIKLWTGRRRHFPNPSDSRKAFNSLLQGGGAEIMKSALIRIRKNVEPKYPYRMLLQVHDSVVGECRRDMAEEIVAAVQKEMSAVAEEKDFGVMWPTEADYWGPKYDVAA